MPGVPGQNGRMDTHAPAVSIRSMEENRAGEPDRADQRSHGPFLKPTRPQGNTPQQALLWSNAQGRISTDTRHLALGRTGDVSREIHPDELSPMPPGAVLQYLPGRLPLAQRVDNGQVETVARMGRTASPMAVAVMLPNGWARTLMPAWTVATPSEALPFFGYTAATAVGDEIFVAALQTEDHVRWSPFQYNTPDLPRTVEQRLARSPGNRLLSHLARCALDYQCYNAQNIFYGRWEGGVAVSAGCNARCLGCISEQPADMPPSPQERLRFVPTVEEITEIGIPHLEGGETILSFGQGCEGEPLLQADLLERSIRALRAATSRGTIHLNTNASSPRAVARLVEAGLDSIRVSMNSVNEERYDAYYRPKAYRFADVEESIGICSKAGITIAINLLYMPGVNDLEWEVERLEGLVERYGVHQVQMRNLNIDPDLYLASQPRLEGRAVGIPAMIHRLRRLCQVGNSTPALKP